MIFVATARWCEDHWVIAAGHDRAVVARDADAYMAERPAIDKQGRVTNGGRAEDYIVEEVEESK